MFVHREEYYMSPEDKEKNPDVIAAVKEQLPLNDKVRVSAGAACVFCGQCEMLCPDYAIYMVDAEA